MYPCSIKSINFSQKLLKFELYCMYSNTVQKRINVVLYLQGVFKGSGQILKENGLLMTYGVSLSSVSFSYDDLDKQHIVITT